MMRGIFTRLWAFGYKISPEHLETAIDEAEKAEHKQLADQAVTPGQRRLLKAVKGC
jgi:hypothetical protein